MRQISEIKVNWKGHVEKYQAAMEELNIDFFARDAGYGNELFLALGHGIGCIGNESWPIVTFGKEWGNLEFVPGMVEIAAVVFNKTGLGGL